MVTETDVVMAYRLLMGREPDNEMTVRNHAANFKTLQDLRAGFMTSPEFREILNEPIAPPRSVGSKPLNWPPESVEVDVAPDILERMVKRIEGEFLYLGTREPHWSVLTADRFKSENIREHEEEFYASGAEPVASLRGAAERSRMDLSHYQSCFELGCGLGRSTIWLARQFPNVTGGDISAAHLEYARSVTGRLGLENISFMHLNQISLYEQLPDFDVFFSIIVLQHNPPPLMAFILETILKKLMPGGVAYFQIPTYLRNYNFSASAYLNSEAPVGDVEVHCVPQGALFDIIGRTGCRIVEIREDSSLGENAISNRLLLWKQES
jgi:SAM-dependent methyltransferase